MKPEPQLILWGDNMYDAYLSCPQCTLMTDTNVTGATKNTQLLIMFFTPEK